MNPVHLLVRTLADLGLLHQEIHFETLDDLTEGPIQALTQRGVIDELEAIKALSAKLYIEYCDLEADETIKKFNFHPFKALERSLLWNNRIAPLWEEGDAVVVATINPFDIEGKKSLEFTIDKKIKLVLVEEYKLRALLKEYFPLTNSQFDELSEMESSQYVEIIGKSSASDTGEVDTSEIDAPPIVRLANKIIADAVERQASDIHIEPGQYGVEVRFRVDGIMSSFLDIPKRLQPYLLSRLKLISGMDIAERRKPQDGRLRVRVGGIPVDMRASSVPTPYGEKLVYRILGSKINNLSFSSLGVPLFIEEQLRRVIDKRGKLFLVTGPTGSGKTTMLYTFLNYLRDGSSNIQTVEDPIEYRIPGINQIQVNHSTGVTFASALRSVLRQDPDIIMVGEIRDEETANIALQAAQTGHLVLSTLHTNDPISAVTRLLNLGVDPFVLGASLEGVIAQRLVRVLRPECKLPVSSEYMDKYGKYIDLIAADPQQLFMSQGCRKCHQSGFLGRTGIYSYLSITEEIEELIYGTESQNTILESAKKNDYQELHDAALCLVRDGKTTFDEIKAFLPLFEERTHSSKTKSYKSEFSSPLPELPEYDEEGPAKKIEKQSILLVEDDEDTRSILALLLEKEMYAVIEAENGQDALNKVYDYAPDIVLCDLMMPIMDGREFLKKMKAHNQTRTIPIIFLTAVNNEENELDLLELGAEDFVGKSTSSEIMLSRVRKVLERQ